MGKLINNLPAKDYHAIDALSASSAKLLLKSPAHYWAEKENPRAPTAAMKNGTLTHTLFFEPDKFEEEYAVMPKYDKRTKFGKEAAEQFEEANQGKTVIDEYAYQRAKEIVAAANANPLVAKQHNPTSFHQYQCIRLHHPFFTPKYLRQSRYETKCSNQRRR